MNRRHQPPPPTSSSSCLVFVITNDTIICYNSRLISFVSLDEMESIQKDLFKRHSDYHIVDEEIGMKLDFIWAPYATNLAHVITEFKRNNTYPYVLVMGSSLWHMLHFTYYSDYMVSLRFLRESLIPFLPVGFASTWGFHLFWLGMPTLINIMPNT
ncbi:unnamed protein product [Lactuca saligna]|uniref:Uncharacterized protein n=1 Tax=Lactuca saligna TaxID=75948 RepID=A0AA36E4J9_LACSI|nr:unnamed protein product [Lactuca saligna]